MLRNLKSLFIIEDKAPPPKAESGSGTSEEPQRTTPASSTGFRGAVKTSGNGVVDDKFLEVLFGALDAKNKEGFDYMEFKEFLRSLANVPMDDKTRYQSAFATAKTMGATRENILSSAQSILPFWEKSRQNFNRRWPVRKRKILQPNMMRLSRSNSISEPKKRKSRS